MEKNRVYCFLLPILDGNRIAIATFCQPIGLQPCGDIPSYILPTHRGRQKNSRHPKSRGPRASYRPKPLLAKPRSPQCRRVRHRFIHQWKGISSLFLKPLPLKSRAAAANVNSKEIVSVEKNRVYCFLLPILDGNRRFIPGLKWGVGNPPGSFFLAVLGCLLFSGDP